MEEPMTILLTEDEAKLIRAMCSKTKRNLEERQNTPRGMTYGEVVSTIKALDMVIDQIDSPLMPRAIAQTMAGATAD